MLTLTVKLGLVPKELRLVGGGSKNKLWQQIVADVFQLPVRCGRYVCQQLLLAVWCCNYSHVPRHCFSLR
jgi:sugar (pentulose or hexulose) kinase